jgi:hypothetical protein
VTNAINATNACIAKWTIITLNFSANNDQMLFINESYPMANMRATVLCRTTETVNNTAETDLSNNYFAG